MYYILAGMSDEEVGVTAVGNPRQHIMERTFE